MSQVPPGQQPQYPQGYPQQYPTPYSPYQMPQVHPMAYAQAQMQRLGWQFSRAGMMLMITGGLMALCGLACGGMSLMPLDQALANAQLDPEVAAIMTPQMVKVALFIFATGSLLYAVLAIVLGIIVRRQSKAATIAAIVLTSLVLVLLLVNMLSGLAQVSRLGAQGAMGECVLLIPLAIFIWQLLWLIQALRTLSPLKAVQAQMQMQYWQMMQMQQQQYQRPRNDFLRDLPVNRRGGVRDNPQHAYGLPARWFCFAASG